MLVVAPPGRVGDRVLKLRRRGTRNQIDETLIIAVVRQRQILDRFLVEVSVDVRLGGLKDRRAALDGDLVGDRAHLDLDVDAGYAVYRNVQARLRVRFEPACADRKVVAAFEQVLNRIPSGLVRSRLP